MPKKTFRMTNPKKRRSKRKQSRRIRRIKHIKGGAKRLNGVTNLGLIWNYMFKQGDLDNKVIHALPQLSEGKKKALFVIDMQNDFVDRYYDRKDQNEQHPVWKDVMYTLSAKDPTLHLFGSGNFAVAAGNEMVKDMTKYVKTAIESTDYSHIIFSRDYHPVGHSSFNKNAFYEKNLCGVCSNSKDNKCNDDDGGVFPAHCVQGKEGAKIINELDDLILSEISYKYKIKIVFKGVHPHCDSYTAVEKDKIDAIASNKNHFRNEESNEEPNKLCSSISGGYKLYKQSKSLTNKAPAKEATAEEATAEEAINFNGVFSYAQVDNNQATFEFIKDTEIYTLKKEDYSYLNDVDIIEVCGLAGDYCVRDTVVALAEKYPNKKIILLNDLTRYPVLPFGTISIIPQHRYLAKADNLPKYADELTRIKSNAVSNAVSKADITDYLILMGDKTRLLTPEEVGKVTAPGGDNPDYWVVLDDGDGLTGMIPPKPTHKPIGHFITPSQVIIDEYRKLKNIKIFMATNPLVVTDESES